MTKIRHDQRGFSLVETLVALGILAIVSSTVGTATFQAVGTQQSVIEDGRAISQLRRGFSWLAGDVQMAESTDLVDGVPSASITLTWTDNFNDAGILHSSSYILTSGDLLRVYDGESHAVMHNTLSATFTLIGTAVQTQFEVDAGGGTSRTADLKLPLGVAP